MRPAGPEQAGTLERWLLRQWWQPKAGAAAWLLQPLAWIYRAGAWLARMAAGAPAPTPVPVLVVGNLVVGGAGKTPVVIALVHALAAAGRRPGVISRGHGRRGGRDVQEVGDEPLLIRRRTAVPVFVGRDRSKVATALCAVHPAVDVIVSDDGLQHHALARAAEIIVFDDRGAGNGHLLPAGPLRQPLPRELPPRAFVVYTGRGASTALPGLHVPRTATHAWPLAAWAGQQSGSPSGRPSGPPSRPPSAHSLAGTELSCVPLSALRGRALTALAGIGAPEQFFATLEAAGLHIVRLPCRDHARYESAPWPADTPEVITTEKDAVKLAALPPQRTPVWVVPLDCALPAPLVQELLAVLQPIKEEAHR